MKLLIVSKNILKNEKYLKNVNNKIIKLNKKLKTLN